MHISGIFVMNGAGDVVVQRFYRDDVSRTATNNFKSRVIAAKEVGASPPVKMIDGSTFMYCRHEDIFFVAVTKGNCNPALVFQFMQNLINIFDAYFSGEHRKFGEKDLRNNFTLVYELLDEVMDFGYPQTTSVDLLQLHINTGEMRKLMAKKNVKLDPKDLTGAVDWRTEGVRHKKNEIFIDVIEQVELLVSVNGAVLRNEVQGRVMMKAFLSGMPECRFGLNDKVSMDSDGGRAGRGGSTRARRSVRLDDCSFHRCVRLGKFEDDRSITFIPPDGAFELMSYRIASNINLPFRVIPVVEERGDTKVVVNVKIMSNFSHKLLANKVVIRIPVPPNTARAKVRAGCGRAAYEPQAKAIVWRIRKLPGGAEHTLNASVELMASSSGRTWSREPIKMEFNVPMFTASGMRVRFLKIYEKSNYNTTKWVRYLTKAGHYAHRI
jgi:AP-2 complex subunit mu-1